MQAKATCPAYITGIFKIGKGDAAGAGFAADLHLETRVFERKSGRTRIFINGRHCPAPVSRAVLARYERILGSNAGALEIRHQAQAPVGFGLGMSAAGALSLSLALNELLGAGLPWGKCVKIAHDAEVECGTGLSGVDAAAIGGFLARKGLSSKPVKLPFEERQIHLAFFSPIKTAGVIRSPSWKKNVNAAGTRALKELFLEKSWEGFLRSSRRFSLESGLAGWCEAQMKANPRASMAMLGRTLFSDAPIKLSRSPILYLRSRTYGGGARLM